MTHEEFHTILSNINGAIGRVRERDQKASSHHNPNDKLYDFSGMSDSEIQRKFLSENPKNGDTARTRGYLLSYVAVAGKELPGQGLILEDGVVKWDKGVIAFCLRCGFLEVLGGNFVLSNEGMAFLGRHR